MSARSAAVSEEPEAAQASHSSSVSRSESQHKEERNFRSHYLEKVGLLGVDEKKTLELLLNEDPVSVSKCSHFAVKCPVPPHRRLHLWKVILGITASHPGNAEYVWQWREKPYSDVMRALKIMQKIDANWPKAKNMAVAYLLFSKCLQFESDQQLGEPRAQQFMAIAETMTTLSQCDVEIFWIAKGLTDNLHDLSQEVMSELVQVFHKKLANHSSTCKLYSHLEKIGLTEEIPLERWIRRGFAGILHESALERIWDKVIGGAYLVLVYVAFQLVETSKFALLGCQTFKEAIRCLTSQSEQTDEITAQQAIESWSAEGHQLLPGEAGGKHLQPHQPSGRHYSASSVQPRSLVKSPEVAWTSEICIADEH
eukprot:maker-scaffold2706_size13069-snap-gene-0.6 protein:Tk08737 transcript:maker-scaffold2706_size13069-snap-gene-0.6-mRNA-1 annotation:"hypothetical protein DAPPUDRAFT_212402"